ncbi:MAG: amidohydrolase family protein [Phycisphaerae bacterium]
MFIDIHGHAYRRPWPKVNGQPRLCTPDQLLQRHDEIGIEKGVLLPLIGPEHQFEYPSSNEDILEIAETYPGRFIPFCNIDPRSLTNIPGGSLSDLLIQYRDRGCKGVGEMTSNLHFLDPLVQNLFRHIAEAGLPLTIHIAVQIGGIYGLYDEPGLPQLEITLRTFPKLTILGHSQTFWAEMGRLETPADRCGYPKYPIREEGVIPKFFRRYPNLYGDLSAGSGHNALARDPDYGIQFLNEFQDRLLFGTDITAQNTPTPLVDLLLDWRNTKKISESVFQKVA